MPIDLLPYIIHVIFIRECADCCKICHLKTANVLSLFAFFFFFFFSQTSPSWSLHSGNFPRTRKLATSYTKCVLIHDLPTNVERWSCIPDVSRANQRVLAKSTRGLRDCCSFIKFHDFLDLFIEFLRGKCWKTRLISWSYSKAFLFLYQFCL